MARPHPKLTGSLPQRYFGTEWKPPGRHDEEAALALASPQAIVELLRPIVDERRAARIDEVAASRLAGVLVVLEDLHDPHNGGAVLRSCEAMGLREVHIIASRERFRVSDKVTQGADKWLDVVEHPSTDSALDQLRQRGFTLAAAVPGASTQLTELDPLKPTALLMGNEHAGLSEQARARCDVEFAIPLHGFSESLNLSVATAICTFSLTSRRRQALGRSGDLDDARLWDLRARYYLRDVRGALSIVRQRLGR
ncbi:MAG: RNA methyltransferase [Myxococcales bacterium]|nr:RNA methyltransferase [Myxococcales bacterium]